MKKLFEFLENWYYRIYRYRLWYNIKCYLWKRYTTIKPRYLPHTWCDSREMLPHMMFEILSQFIEKECTPPHDIVDWNADETCKHARQEMQELYDWWHKIYNKKNREDENELWEKIRQCKMKMITIPYGKYHKLEFQFENEEKETRHKKLVKEATQLEIDQYEELVKQMKRLSDITCYLWT